MTAPASDIKRDGPAWKRVSLIKDRVGCVRAPSFPLPPFSHVYGDAKVPNKEGAGEILGKWVTPKASAAAKAQKSYIRTNVKALHDGHITAKSQREYSLTHPDILVPKPQACIRERFQPPKNRTYGKPSVRGEENMKLLVEGYFNPHMNKPDVDYPDVSHMVKPGRTPKPLGTKSSRLLAECKQGKESEASAKLFVMKKFLNVPSKIVNY